LAWGCKFGVWWVWKNHNGFTSYLFDVVLKTGSSNKEDLEEGSSRWQDKEYKNVKILEESLIYEESILKIGTCNNLFGF